MAAEAVPHRVALNRVRIPNGESVSTMLSIPGYRLIAIITPSALDGVKFRFEASTDAQHFFPVKNSLGQFLEVVYGVDTYIQLDESLFPGVFYLKLQTVDNNGDPVVQSAERTIDIVYRS